MRLTPTRPAIAALLTLLASCSSPSGSESGLRIEVLSSRPDMITGGDALIRIDGIDASSDWASTVNDGDAQWTDVRTEGERSIVGLLKGLRLGANTLVVRQGSDTASIDLVNYPITGPVFSGPHQTPYICQTELWDLGPPLDENCSAETRVKWLYKPTSSQSTGAAAFKPLNSPDDRPDDLATIEVNGQSVPYIVRVETGTINRAVYQIAKLEGAWNGRLIYTFGGSCMAGYVQGKTNGGVLNDLHLSRGYAVASSSLNVFGNNCNGVVSAETLMMVKERFIETIGVPKYTIGWGSSGGAMAQYEIAQNYPGLLDGIVPLTSFADAITYFIESEDCRLLLRPYLNSTTLTEEQKVAITGVSTWATCDDSLANRPGRLDPKDCDASIPESLRYHPTRNPGGARCSVYDGMVNIFGRDPKTGFARRPHDNVGVQYGLRALNEGIITKEQFLDLNEKIGGYDIETNRQPQRTVGDPEAIRIAYESGKTVTGKGSLAWIPIIDARAYLDAEGNFHESYHSFRARARLIAENGDADNQVILRAPKGAVFQQVQAELLSHMEQWLDALTADTSERTPREKTLSARPAALTDACWTEDGRKIAEPAVYGANSECNRLYPPHSSPRLAAGAPLAGDIWKCKLKPIDWSDYSVEFTEAERARLQRIFPEGVCDWSHPGMYRAPLKGVWQTY